MCGDVKSPDWKFANVARCKMSTGSLCVWGNTTDLGAPSAPRSLRSLGVRQTDAVLVFRQFATAHGCFMLR